MQDVVPIPTWVISTIIPGLIAWLVWLTVQTFRNQQKIAVNTANDMNVQAELMKIHESIRELKKEMNERLDSFLSKEIDLLKDALKHRGQ